MARPKYIRIDSHPDIRVRIDTLEGGKRTITARHRNYAADPCAGQNHVLHCLWVSCPRGWTLDNIVHSGGSASADLILIG